MDSFALFFELGFRHILEGYDHLLFLTGLIIVTRDWRALLAVVSAFTVTHSTTLVLSALEIMSLPTALTETLIAASIAYVGIENVVAEDQRQRWIVAGGFGLVHGAGFSSHLTGLLQTALGGEGIWGSLIGFNVGIEVGQVVVIAITAPVMWLLERQGLLQRIIPEVSRMIAAVGLFLVITRIWEL